MVRDLHMGAILEEQRLLQQVVMQREQPSLLLLQGQGRDQAGRQQQALVRPLQQGLQEDIIVAHLLLLLPCN
jgi:hypothetical protein